LLGTASSATGEVSVSLTQPVEGTFELTCRTTGPELPVMLSVEAFAAQSLAVQGRLGLADDDARVCADGGALALGHPWGASGAVALVRLFSRLVRAEHPAGSIGVAAASVGGGMGIAMVVEAVR
jgi:acetyl-CoA acetyltransferase